MLWAAVAATMYLFWPVNTLATYLLVPYLGWCVFLFLNSSFNSDFVCEQYIPGSRHVCISQMCIQMDLSFFAIGVWGSMTTRNEFLFLNVNSDSHAYRSLSLSFPKYPMILKSIKPPMTLVVNKALREKAPRRLYLSQVANKTMFIHKGNCYS